jgi:MFS family permease
MKIKSIIYKMNSNEEMPLTNSLKNGIEDPQETEIQGKKGRPGSKFKIILFGIIVDFDGFLMGYFPAQFSTFFEYFMRGKFGTSVGVGDYDNILSFLNAIFIIGSFAAVVLSIYFIKNFSLKKLQIICIICNVVVNVIAVFTPLSVLYALRFLNGIFTTTLFALGPIIVNHICPSDYIGLITSIFSLFLGLGSVVASAVSSDISEKFWYLFYCLIVPIELIRFFMLIFVFPYESPNFVFNTLYNKKPTQNHQKLESLKEVPSEIKVSTTPGEKVQRNKSQIREEFINHPEVNRLVTALYVKEDVEDHKLYMFEQLYLYESQKSTQTNIFAIACSKKFRKPFSLAALLYWANQGSGIFVVLLYSKQIFINLKFSNPDLLVFIGSKSY